MLVGEKYLLRGKVLSCHLIPLLTLVLLNSLSSSSFSVTLYLKVILSPVDDVKRKKSQDEIKMMLVSIVVLEQHTLSFVCFVKCFT